MIACIFVDDVIGAGNKKKIMDGLKHAFLIGKIEEGPSRYVGTTKKSLHNY